VLRALGRFEETPPELVLDFDGEHYRVLGTPDEANMEVGARKVAQMLTSEPQTYGELAKTTGLTQAMVRKVVRRMDGIVKSGEGKKGDPHRVRKA
jgi:hypothetical protein